MSGGDKGASRKYAEGRGLSTRLSSEQRRVFVTNWLWTQKCLKEAAVSMCVWENIAVVEHSMVVAQMCNWGKTLGVSDHGLSGISVASLAIRNCVR